MEKMIDHIFTLTYRTDRLTRRVNRMSLRQRHCDIRVSILTAGVIVYISAAELRRKYLEERIAQLSEELQIMKGEQ